MILSGLGRALTEGLRKEAFGNDYKEKQALERADISQAPARAKAIELANQGKSVDNEGAQFDLDQARADVEQKRKLVAAGAIPSTDLKVAEFMLRDKESKLQERLTESQIGMNEAHSDYYRKGPQPGKPLLKQNIDGTYTWMYPPGSGGGNVTTDVKAPLPATARTQAEARQLVAGSIDEVEKLSKGIMSGTGVGQRAGSIGRGVNSALGNDANFKVYQDARMALAGNLAVAQQGSRPSDADIKAIWLPLVPDPYSDTSESSKMKWQLIRQMSHVGQGQQTTVGGVGGPAVEGAPQAAPDWNEDEWLSKYGGGQGGAP